MHRVLLVSLILISGVTRAMATDWPLLSGRLSGDFRLRALSGAPPIQWSLEAPESTDDANQLIISARTKGLDLKVRFAKPVDGTSGRWEILAGRLDIALWWPMLVDSGLMTEMPADLSLIGEVLLAGQGTLNGMTPMGDVKATIWGGSMSSASQEWSVPSLDITGHMRLAEDEMVIDSLSLVAPRAEVLGFIVEDIDIQAMGETSSRLRVLETKMSLFGGQVRVRPFTFDLNQPEIATSVELQDVALSELAALVPEALSEAQGRLSGALEIGWSASMGVQAGKGALQLSKDTATTLRLAATPGFLTQHAPKKIQWLPAMMGSLAQWLALDNPAFETLQKIEMGEMGLTVDTLDVALYPDGPDGVVSARVAVSARPSDGSFVEEVSFDVSVTGPLKDVLLLSADERVKIGVKSK